MPRRTEPSDQQSRRAPAGEGALYSVIKEDGSASPRTDPGLPEDQLLYLYRTMVQTREFDRRMLVLQRQGRIGFYGPILGQEAATVGSVASLEDRDWIFPALREGAAAIMRGLPLAAAIAQLVGNSKDRAKGRQMPCHYTFAEGRYHAMSSVVGTQICHAVGAAMAAKIRGDDIAVLGYLGDGATSTNDFHAGMNFAGVRQAPVVLFCQNNQWAISVPLDVQSASETLAQKGEAYGIPYARVDGNDVLAVDAVEVFELLARRYPRLELVFVGDGSERRRLERRITSGGEDVRARVHMAGALPEMVAVLADLDVVLATSRSEGLPVALIEAAAAGKPAVATPVGGVPELVAHERTGFLGEGVDELAYGLAQLLDSADLRAEVGKRARVRVRERYSAQALADRLEAVYGAVLAQR